MIRFAPFVAFAGFVLSESYISRRVLNSTYVPCFHLVLTIVATIVLTINLPLTFKFPNRILW